MLDSQPNAVPAEMQAKPQEKESPTGGAYRFGEFDLYPSERQMRQDQRTVPLAPKVFDALLLLVRKAGRLVRRDELIEALWPDTFVTEANLTNLISTLRKILGREAIQTVSKFGYRFCMPVSGEPGVDAATYATFLQAKDLVAERSLETMARARDLLALCVALDPTFAAAWAWLGRCCRFMGKFKAEPTINVRLAQAALDRALAIDPSLACAHHFLTPLQADLGQSREAMVRLARRIAQQGDEPESFAGLVQVLRYCGLLDESLAAHARATELDATVATSVQHTYFLRCDYAAAIDTYSGTRYYLDAAAWAALGDRARARQLLGERLEAGQLSAQMSGLMSSLLAVLEDRPGEAMGIIEGLEVGTEPEALFYLARHLAMLGAVPEAVQQLRRARSAGFAAPYTLMHDAAFAPLSRDRDFAAELQEARARECEARRALQEAGGAHLEVNAAAG